MKIVEPRHLTDPQRTAQDRAAHLRYMKARQQSRSRMSLSSQYDIPRRMLRDSSAMMYPERVTGENWKPGAVAAEVEAAEKRHANPQPAPITTPAPPAKRGAKKGANHYTKRYGPMPRKFERRASA